MKTLAILALLALLVGCSPSAFGQHYQSVTVLAASHHVAYEAVTEARAVELDAAEAAHPTRGPERDAALDAVAGRFAAAGAGLDSVLSALETWAAAVAVARAADEDESLLPSLLDMVRQVAGLYADVVGLARAGFGVELPALPSFITSLLGGT